MAGVLALQWHAECTEHDNQQIKFAIELITVKYHKTTLPYLENRLLAKTELIYCMLSFLCDGPRRNLFAMVAKDYYLLPSQLDAR